MLLHNIIYTPPEPDNAVRVEFNTLKVGDKFQHSVNGWVSVVYFKADDYMTIKRPDGWLVVVAKDGEVWGKMVIKVKAIRK